MKMLAAPSQPLVRALKHESPSTAIFAELLAILKGYRFLSDYSLTIVSRGGGNDATPVRWQPVGQYDCSPLCTRFCAESLSDSLTTVMNNDRPMVFRCPAGILTFAVPLPSPDATPCCLLGGGVREDRLDLRSIEMLAEREEIDPFELLAHLESLPRATRGELEQVSRKVSNLVFTLLGERNDATFAEKTVTALRAVVGLSTDIDQAETADEAVSLLSEALGILFDVSCIAVALANDDATGFRLCGTWGLPLKAATLTNGDLHRLFSPHPGGAIVLSEDSVGEIFPTASASQATCVPIVSGTELLGMVSYLDRELPARDLYLTELLAGRVASRLVQLRKDREHERQQTLSGRYLEMFGILAATESTADLYRNILEMAAELVHATCGSLMFLDADRERLNIETAIGINPKLARNLTSKIGVGIAGRVAESGHPFVVNDIEQDTRIATHNRPRFKTKSFISIPLAFRGETIGVLNLSDKADGAIYTERDMELLRPFVDHAAALVSRSRSLDRADFFEKLSVTDPLTGLFNRRFLERRMEEELSRGRRHGHQMTVMMIDLDHFKIYNDQNGHVAGDKALKKAARIVQASVRDIDVVTRYGGEEFCILLPATSKKESLFVADRIRRGIEKDAFTGEEGLPVGRLTASIGIGSYPEDGDTADDLINAADKALYRAKHDGRNRIVLSASPAGCEPLVVSSRQSPHLL